MNKELKEVRLADVKIEEIDNKMILEGYAICFDSETLIGNEDHGFYEVIDRNALADTLLRDVPMKYNHMDSFLIIARTKNQSLQLSIDNIGLKVHAELIDTQSNQDIYKMVRSGLLDKMSFAFTVKEQTWNREGNVPKRIITKIDRLYDVSVVDTPAYDATSIHARSVEAMELELQTMDLVKSNEKIKVMKQRLKIKSKI